MDETSEIPPGVAMQRLQVAADALEKVLATAGGTVNIPAIPAAAVLFAVEEFDREYATRVARQPPRRKRRGR